MPFDNLDWTPSAAACKGIPPSDRLKQQPLQQHVKASRLLIPCSAQLTPAQAPDREKKLQPQKRSFSPSHSHTTLPEKSTKTLSKRANRELALCSTMAQNRQDSFLESGERGLVDNRVETKEHEGASLICHPNAPSKEGWLRDD